MTTEEKLRRKAVATIRHLEGLVKLVHTVATGKPGPRVRKKRKKAVKRKPLAKKREKRPDQYDTALWDFVAD
jgi:hypothetical protein